MANKKFSEFVLKTSTSDVSHIVGYNGAENVQITPANFVTGGGTGVFLPLAGGTMTGVTQFNDHTQHGDQVQARFGAANDLVIEHNGSGSFIKDNGTGGLTLQANADFAVQSTGTNENFISAATNAFVKLFFDGSEKLATTNTGISVTGEGVFTGSVKLSGSTSYILNNDNEVLTGSDAGGYYFGLVTSANSSKALFIGDHNIYMRFDTNGSEKMRLDASGNLGVGVVPSNGYKLDVFDSSEALFRIRTSNATGNGGVYIGNGDRNWALLVRHSQAESFEIRDETANATRLSIDSSGNSTFSGNIILNNNTGELQSKDAGGVAARILTMDNADTLILGNITTVDDIRFDVDTYGEAAMMIKSSGKVGINEDNPAAKLVVNQDSLVDTEGIFVQSGGAAGGGGVAIFKSASLIGSISSLGANSSLTFLTNLAGTTSEAMRINAEGQVSINNTDSGAGLTVFEDDTSIWHERQSANTNTTGTAQKMTVIRHIASTGLGTILEIPFTSQGSANISTILKIWGHSAIFNSNVPKAFEATITVGHLTSVSNLSVLSSSGNIASVTVSGMSVFVNFTTNYHNATLDRSGLNLTLEYMTTKRDRSIIISGLALN